MVFEYTFEKTKQSLQGSLDDVRVRLALAHRSR